MRFILRCVFWLTIVYASMAWSRGVFNHIDFHSAEMAAPADAARHAVMSLAGKAKDQAADYCRHHASECLAEAAKLGALFSSATTTDHETTTASTASSPGVPCLCPTRVGTPVTPSWQRRAKSLCLCVDPHTPTRRDRA